VINIYLTSELKQFYLDDFNKISQVSIDFWKIEPEILPYLTIINKNKKIQPIYSKYGVNDSIKGSYIKFCYFQELEEQLFKSFLPDILEEFNDLENVTCVYEFHYPHENPNYDKKTALGISATDNPEHFRVNHIKLTLRSYKEKYHLSFWKELSDRLFKIK